MYIYILSRLNSYLYFFNCHNYLKSYVSDKIHEKKRDYKKNRDWSSGFNFKINIFSHLLVICKSSFYKYIFI